MADYTAIANSETNPGAPLTSSLMKRLAANPEAIAEGASGATRIRTAALVPPAAGNVILSRWSNLMLFEITVSLSSYLDPGLGRTEPNWDVVRGGTVRAGLEHRAASGSSSWVRILRNLTVMDEWSTSSTDWVARFLDFSVSPGDRILMQSHTSGGVGDTGQWRGMRIMSNSQNLAVV